MLEFLIPGVEPAEEADLCTEVTVSGVMMRQDCSLGWVVLL
jgi:hypothetical protein